MKIRTDFVTNSSSSSFVAYGIYDEELANKINELLKTHNPYPDSSIGYIYSEDGVVSVTRELSDVDGWGSYAIFAKLEDAFDERTAEEIDADQKEALNADNIMEALSGFFGEDFPGEKEKKLISAAVREGGAKCEVYADQTDGYDPRDFSYDARGLSANRDSYRAKAEARKAKRESGVVTTHEFSENVKFRLSSNFTLERETDDDGEEVVRIYGSEYEDDDGETCYGFTSTISEVDYSESDFDGEDVNSANLLEKLVDRLEDCSIKKISDSVYIFVKYIPFSIFGRTLKTLGFSALIKTSAMKVLTIVSSHSYSDEIGENQKMCEDFVEVLNSTRVNDKKIDTGIFTSRELLSLFESAVNGDTEAVDVSPKITLNIGDESVEYQYSDGGFKAVGAEGFTRAKPDSSQYPHYNSIRNAGGLGFLGDVVVVNSTGTEYSFNAIKDLFYSDDGDNPLELVAQRIVEKDTARYTLDQKARVMQKLFRVNPSAFNSKRDRECELENGYIHRAYMVNGLRSFAWTLAEYCEKCELAPEELDYARVDKIVEFVAKHDWLNYEGDSHCPGLCSGSDLHAYFIPDGVSVADRKRLLPSQERIDEVKKIQEKLPSYNPILSEVHSLNELRNDIEYIFPAVRTLWENLEEDRDYDEPLTGNQADIVYAWCAFALAAKEPFFTEDGPVNCWFDQIEHSNDEIDTSLLYDEGKYIAKTKSTSKKSEDTSLKKTTVFRDENHEGEYVVIDNDWAVKLPEGWVHTTDPEKTGNRPLIALSRECYEDMGEFSPYADNCFTVFRKDPMSLLAMMAGAFMNQGSDAFILRDGLKVTYNCHHEGSTTYCQYVVVTTNEAIYTIQFFYSDPKQNKKERIKNIEAVLNTICLVDEMPEDDCEANSESLDFEVKSSHKTNPFSKRIKYHISEQDKHYASIDECEMNGDCLVKYKGPSPKPYLVLPDGIKTVSHEAISDKGLKGIIFGEGLSYLGGVDIIDDSESTKTLEYIYLPASLSYVSNAGRDRRITTSWSLRYYDVSDDNRNFTSIDGVLYAVEDGKLTLIDVPSSTTKLTIGKDVVAVWDGALRSAGNLESITVDLENHKFSTINGLLCELVDGDWVLRYVPTTWDEEFVCPDGIAVISRDAFYHCESEKIFLPESVKMIEDEAFEMSDSLVSLYIPSMKTILSDKAKSFPFEWMERWTIHCQEGSEAAKTAIEMGWAVDYSYYSMSAKDDCNRDAEDVQNTPQDNAHCKDKKLCNVEKSESDFDIQNGDILLQYRGTEIDIVIPKGVTQIAESALLFTQIESVVVPEGVTSIGECAFSNTHNLKKVVLPRSLKKIGTNAFSFCDALESIIIPDGCEEIGAGCFGFCANLNDIYVPYSVHNIGGNAFFTNNPNTVVHTTKGSVAEAKARECLVQADYQAAPCSGYSTSIDNANDLLVKNAECKAHEDEAMRKAKEVASGNSIEEAYRKAQEDAERRKREVAERQAREEAERKKREEIERKCREAEERRIRAEEERKAKEEAERKAREEERRAREEAQRKAEEEAKRKLEQEKENAIKGRAEFTATEKEKIDQAYEKMVSELTAAFEAKRRELQNQIEINKKLCATKEQELAQASFFAFIRKKNLKRDIELIRYQMKKTEDEMSALLKDHTVKLHDEEIKRKNKIDALPMRAAKKFPMPK